MPISTNIIEIERVKKLTLTIHIEGEDDIERLRRDFQYIDLDNPIYSDVFKDFINKIHKILIPK